MIEKCLQGKLTNVAKLIKIKWILELSPILCSVGTPIMCPQGIQTWNIVGHSSRQFLPLIWTHLHLFRIVKTDSTAVKKGWNTSSTFYYSSPICQNNQSSVETPAMAMCPTRHLSLWRGWKQLLEVYQKILANFRCFDGDWCFSKTVMQYFIGKVFGYFGLLVYND